MPNHPFKLELETVIAKSCRVHIDRHSISIIVNI